MKKDREGTCDKQLSSGMWIEHLVTAVAFAASSMLFDRHPQLPAFTAEHDLLPMWTPLIPRSRVSTEGMNKVWLEDRPFVLYRNTDKQWQLVYDVCPHQGASLYRGELTDKKCLVCPYHGFRFMDGRLVHPVNARGNVLSLHVTEDAADGMIYFIPWVDKHMTPGYIHSTDPVFRVPESTDPAFSRIDGYRVVDVPSLVLTENVLDMLHISYVHSFGNRAEPFPFDIQYRKIDETSGRTVFMYHSGPTSLSKRIAGRDIITVENEFHLPSTTVTRVHAGNLTKTIVTRTVPYRKGKTGFFYTIYYNFHRGWLMDGMLRWSMEKTLEEDMGILRHVYADLRTPLLNTKYDKTILAFRTSRQKMWDRLLLSEQGKKSRRR